MKEIEIRAQETELDLIPHPNFKHKNEAGNHMHGNRRNHKNQIKLLSE